MSIDFSVEPVDEIPKKLSTRKERSSKYQPIIDKFLSSGYSLVRVDNTGLSGSYLAIVLNKIIKKRGDSVKVSIRNNEVYLEK